VQVPDIHLRQIKLDINRTQ